MPEELDAGIRGFTEEVAVIVRSGDPGAGPGEFVEFIRGALGDWYDGARIYTSDEYREMVEAEDAALGLEP
jgi:hypothetical protein